MHIAKNADVFSFSNFHKLHLLGPKEFLFNFLFLRTSAILPDTELQVQGF